MVYAGISIDLRDEIFQLRRDHKIITNLICRAKIESLPIDFKSIRFFSNSVSDLKSSMCDFFGFAWVPRGRCGPLSVNIGFTMTTNSKRPKKWSPMRMTEQIFKIATAHQMSVAGVEVDLNRNVIAIRITSPPAITINEAQQSDEALAAWKVQHSPPRYP